LYAIRGILLDFWNAGKSINGGFEEMPHIYSTSIDKVYEYEGGISLVS
jgi:hypothetical protein